MATAPVTPSGNTTPVQQAFPPGIQPYINNGLTYQSNNPDIITRDDNGNIIVNQSAQNNQNLVVEAMSLRYVNTSVVRAIDTRFKYFKFPVEDISIPDISIAPISDIIDPLFAKYAPSETRVVSSTNIPSGILMDTVISGLPQLVTNAYSISEIVKESGASLRFRIRLNHSYIMTGGGQSAGTIFFTIIKANSVTGVIEREFIVLTNTADASISTGQIRTKNYDVTISNSNFVAGDRFSIGAVAGQFNSSTANGPVEVHAIRELGSFWSITDAALDVDINNISNSDNITTPNDPVVPPPTSSGNAEPPSGPPSNPGPPGGGPQGQGGN